jgi:hypothetical protein
VIRLARDRRGLALPFSLLGVVAIGLLGAGIWVVVDLNARSMANRESTARALQLAEAGAAHTMSVMEEYLSDRTLSVFLLGSDSLEGTADDGLLIGYGLPQSVQIPQKGYDWGDGTYTVTFLDDPSEGDGDELRDRNGRILVRCTGRVQNQGSATVDFVFGTDPIPPAIVVDGDITLDGSVELLGSCGGVYANGLVDVTGTLVVGQSVISSDTVEVSGSIVDPNGGTVPPLSNQALVDIPDYDLWDTCAGADYILGDDGWITNTSTGTRHRGSGNGHAGWADRSHGQLVLWEFVNFGAVEGTFCVKGNAKIDGGLGTEADPFAMTVYATGGITVTGSIMIEPDHPDGYLLMAQGDLKLSGNASGVSPEVWGILYAGSQCMLSGTPQVAAQLFCDDAPDPAGAIDYAESNTIDGNIGFTYACPPPGATQRRALAWFQRFGS